MTLLFRKWDFWERKNFLAINPSYVRLLAKYVFVKEGEGGQLVEVDASGGQLVEVDAGDGEVVEEDEEACCEIVNWIKNKHETSGILYY